MTIFTTQNNYIFGRIINLNYLIKKINGKKDSAAQYLHLFYLVINMGFKHILLIFLYCSKILDEQRRYIKS